MCAAGPAAIPSPCLHADLAVGGGGGRVVKQADGQEEQVVASHYDNEACKGWREGSREVRAREGTLRIQPWCGVGLTSCGTATAPGSQGCGAQARSLGCSPAAVALARLSEPLEPGRAPLAVSTLRGGVGRARGRARLVGHALQGAVLLVVSMLCRWAVVGGPLSCCALTGAAGRPRAFKPAVLLSPRQPRRISQPSPTHRSAMGMSTAVGMASMATIAARHCTKGSATSRQARQTSRATT